MNISSWNTLDPKVKNLWRLNSLVRAVMLTVPVALVLLILGANASVVLPRFAWFIPAGVFLVTLIWGQLLVNRSYDCYRFRLGEDDIAVARGIFWKSWRFVNRNRVQHVDLHAGPIARALGLVQINIYVGGMPEAAATIPGLAVAKGEELRSRLIKADVERPLEPSITEPPIV